MMAFLLISLGELSSGRSVLQQLSVHPIWTTFFAVTLSVASVMPKVCAALAVHACAGLHFGFAFPRIVLHQSDQCGRPL